MAAPDRDTVKAYLGTTSRSDATIDAALAAEKAAQAAVCRVPAQDAQWPADLVEALCRRVAHNLAVRGNALGAQVAETAFGATVMRVGGTDPEVRRLEAPHRRVSFG